MVLTQPMKCLQWMMQAAGNVNVKDESDVNLRGG